MLHFEEKSAKPRDFGVHLLLADLVRLDLKRLNVPRMPLKARFQVCDGTFDRRQSCLHVTQTRLYTIQPFKNRRHRRAVVDRGRTRLSRSTEAAARSHVKSTDPNAQNRARGGDQAPGNFAGAGIGWLMHLVSFR